MEISSKTAVVVDDELITRLAFSRILEELGFTIAGLASDGFDAIELCRKHHPDIILLDLKMPIFDGSTTAERIIQENLAGSVIIVSAYCDEQTVMRAIKAGVSAYLVKPVDRRQLFPVVSIALEQQKRTSQLNERALAAENKIEEWKLIDRAKAQFAETYQISESEAYHQMQKLAMDKRTSLIQVARHLLESEPEHNLINCAKQLLMEQQGLSEKAAFKQISKFAQEQGCSMADAAKSLLENRGAMI